MKIFKRLGDGFSCVNPYAWLDKTVVIIGGGPSITEAQMQIVERARDRDSCRVLAINNAAIQLAPFADVLYAADPRWWEWHRNDLALKEFAGEKSSIQIENYKHQDDVHVIRNLDYPNHTDGLSLSPFSIRTGSHGGWQAMNIAILAGTKKIFLLGFDGAPDKDGKSHFHKGHPIPTPPQAYKYYQRSFSAAEKAIQDAGVQVINCSLASRIDTFPKQALTGLLE